MKSISQVQGCRSEKDIAGSNFKIKSDQFGYGLPNMTELEIKAKNVDLMSFGCFNPADMVT